VGGVGGGGEGGTEGKKYQISITITIMTYSLILYAFGAVDVSIQISYILS
jgi:hypothetical protein